MFANPVFITPGRYISIVRVITRKWHARVRCEERKGELFFSFATYGFVAHSHVRLPFEMEMMPIHNTSYGLCTWR